MVGEIYKCDSFVWLDVCQPSREELNALARQYNLHATSVEDCLEPKHLPKFEVIGGTTFIIARAFDEYCSPQADTVFGLTRKVAIFLGETFVITIHRAELPFLTEFMERWRAHTHSLVSTEKRLFLIARLLEVVTKTYETPLEEAEKNVDSLETRIFAQRRTKGVVEEIHTLKQRAAVMRKMLKMTLEVAQKLDRFTPEHDPYFQDILEHIGGRLDTAGQIVDNGRQLLDAFLSLSAHATNRVMRILTIYSVFFMPLTFIVGIYGMNFEYMPELHSKYGYPAAMGFMGAVSLGIYLYFRRKGWLN